MGTGSSQEAEFTLVADVPAGEWVLVADGIVVRPVDVTFELFARRAGVELPIGMFQQHFDPLPMGFDAQPFEARVTAPAIAQAGDELVFRYTGANADTPMAYIPDGDGARANGRIPFVDLPE
ncbi:MAG: hypothetical protein R3B06_06200 [Kofleriaceae bacterium]